MNLIFNSIESLEESNDLINPLQKVKEDKCDYFCLIRLYNELYKYQVDKKSTATLTCYKETQDIKKISIFFKGLFKSVQVNLQSLKFSERLIITEKIDTVEDSFTYTFSNNSNGMIALMYKLAERETVNDFLQTFNKEIKEKIEIPDFLFQKYYKDYDQANSFYLEEVNKKEIKLLYYNFYKVLIESGHKRAVKSIRIDFEKSFILQNNKIDKISILVDDKYKSYKLDMPIHFSLTNALDSVSQYLEPNSDQNMKMYCIIHNNPESWAKFDEKVAEYIYPEFKKICFENYLNRTLNVKSNTVIKNKI